MICPWCSYENLERAKFCGDCGKALQFDLGCAVCGSENPRDDHFCGACGARLAALPTRDKMPSVERGAHTYGGSSTQRVAPVGQAVGVAPSSPSEASEAATPHPRHGFGWLPAPGLRWDTPALQWEMSREYLRSWVASHWLEVLAVAVCTAVAAFLRIYRLADIPPGLTGDEAITGMDALRVLEEGWIGPYVGSALGQPTGPLYFTALVFKLSHASVFTLRLSMSLLGVATVPAAYVLFRMGFGRGVALFGMVALTFSYWHLHYSRIAFMLISMPLLTTVTSIAILSALRSARRWPWIVAGLLLGAGVYTYNGYALFAVAIAIFLAIMILLCRHEWRDYMVRVGLLAAGSVLVGLPMIHLILHKPAFYFQHHRLVSLLGDPAFTNAETIGEKVELLASRAWDAATLLYSHPGIDFSDAMGGRGTMNPALALLAYIGLVIALLRWRSPPHLLLALAVILGLGFVTLGGENWGELRRSFVAVPFVYGLFGVAAVEIIRLVKRFFGGVGHRLAAAGAGVVLVAAISWNSWYYFGHLVRQDYLDWVFASDLVAGLNAAHSFEDPGRIYFYASRWGYDYETRRFLYPGSRGIDRSREFGEFSLERLDPGPVTYLLLPPYAKQVEALREMYPGGVAVEEFNDGGGRLFSVYHLR